MVKLWGGRFSKATNKLVEEFTGSIHFDQKLAEADVIGSLYHIDVLKKARLISSAEYKKLAAGLRSILNEIRNGKFKADPSFEDIHSCIQHLLGKKAGKAVLKLHTCRSRNDQVVFDVKLYALSNLFKTWALTSQLAKTLTDLAKKNKNVCIPGYTHLQHAIPVALTDYLGAYVAMLHRDAVRISQTFENIPLTLGAGALAGTMIPASLYNFSANEFLPKGIRPTENALDSVSDRDFVVASLSDLSILGMHLSRLAEDMILWSSKEFDFIDIDDAFCTGSSLMPQKKNPDVLELVRGYTGRLYGNLVSVLTMMKGLPLSYNRDMQLDKEPLFDSFEIIQKELKVLAELFKNVTFKEENIEKQLQDESLYATDLSDYLVQNKVPFKEAHTIIGKLIQYKLKSGEEIWSMPDETLKNFHPLLNGKVTRKIINPEHSVNSKKSVKRTSPRLP
ncbi:MAG: argininosuccinate lyase [Candidatus Omnitrophota bacterium]|nr:argininosuccinate lyase [Candidatus Omnitrophota bacterium]MDZ4241247.1 argininosuccinate lyase [Candidatus Omnitrophota bacterium]